MRSLSDATAKVTNTTFGRKYVSLGRIVSQWESIVGADLATKAQPSKLRYRKFKNKNAKPDAILEIATSSAYATKLHYQKLLILERINQIFGDEWITDIRFININNSAPKIHKPKKREGLNELEKKYLLETLDSIDDIDVKQRLESLGKSLLLDSEGHK